MKLTKILLIAAFCATALFAATQSQASGLCTDPVETASGLVRGMDDPDTATCAWKGIPYAAAPVGELRWKAPEPHPGWSGVLEATEFSRQCMQVEGPLVDKSLGFSEDCLYLNIWSPRKSGTFPVMFWIHGGGLTIGSASIPMYYGHKLADQQEVVLVSINYRLGPFGFYALPGFEDENPQGRSGNYGLLDQVGALKWVRDNIAGFGGDPDNVTIFGESAGGRSVCNLLACPLARGLFHQAVIQSGGCGADSMEKCNADAEVFAAAVGCQGPGAAACMRTKSADEIIATVRKDAGVGEIFSEERFDFGMCVDGWALEDDPLEVIRSGNHNNVPTMVGTNRDEFKLFALMSFPPYRLLTGSMLDRMSGDRFAPDQGSVDHYQELYPPRSYRRPADAWVDGVTDATFGCRGIAAVDAIAPHQPRTYYYRFDYDNHRFPHLVGAAHGVEIVYIFDTLKQEGIFNIYSKKQLQEAEPLVDMMMGYWTNFARTGDPNGPGLPQWPAYTSKNRQRMHLDLPAGAMPAHDIVEKCEFWEQQEAGW